MKNFLLALTATALSFGVSGCSYVQSGGAKVFDAAEASVELASAASERADGISDSAAIGRVQAFERRIASFGAVADDSQAAVFEAWARHEARVQRYLEWSCRRAVAGKLRIGALGVLCSPAPEFFGADSAAVGDGDADSAQATN